MQFDGDDDYVKIDSPEPGTEFTISLYGLSHMRVPVQE